jgi:hypothetical protein
MVKITKAVEAAMVRAHIQGQRDGYVGDGNSAALYPAGDVRDAYRAGYRRGTAERKGEAFPDIDPIAELEAKGGCGAARVRFPRFFSIDDGKAVKAQTAVKGWLNAINYMAPADSAGVGNLCPFATAGCKALCLGEWSGQAGMRKEGMDNSVTLSRKAKARFYMQDRQAFLAEAAYHIDRALARARSEGKRLCVRMNGSTDIAWERSGLMQRFPTVQFLDYTKSRARMLSWCRGGMPANYHLTFSRSETNEADCLAVLAEGGQVAVVSADKRPALWHNSRTVDGDRHDLRHLDRKGAVIWLLPKGHKAKADASGFVLRNGAKG